MSRIENRNSEEVVLKFTDLENINKGDFVEFSMFNVSGEYEFVGVETQREKTVLSFDDYQDQTDIVSFKISWDKFNFGYNSGSIEKID